MPRIEVAEAGKCYVVISDVIFDHGEVVVALENSSIPKCVSVNDYDGNLDSTHYRRFSILLAPLELEELPEK